ncbi:MAG: hypothetical protein LBS56_08625, partial [Propionibacteriaceae bacterium]|nr:hypothetical protein [Propionibacteriaceae bacterium]
MAWFAAVALAVSGLTFYQGAQAPQAGAVTLTGGWDGVFKRDQLWSVNTPTLVGITGGQSADGGGWEKPWEPAQLTSANRTQWMDASGSANGAGLSLHSTIAVGPLFKAEGDSELAMVTFSPGRYMRVIGPRTVTGGTVKLDATEWAELASTDELGDYCQVASAYGGEVNQKNGYLYVTGRAAFAWEGDNTTGQTDFHSSIYQLWKNQTFKCLVSSRGKLLRPKSGKSINQQWQEQFGSSVTGNWTITSDIAIDTYGNFYLWGRNADDKHVLLSMQPPKNEDGSYFAGGDWYYEVVKFFTTNAANDATGGGMAFMNGKLYIYLSNNRMQEWDPLSGAVVDKGVVSTGNRDIDLASAQMAPVLQGTVYNDADGDGVIAADEVGAPNVEVEIWQQTGSATPVRKGSITTNTDGNYYALLPSDTDNFYLRVKQPQIGGVNALQTYASGGTFTYDTDGDGREDAATETNTVTPLCQGAGGDYSPRPGSGPCAGARADWVDPTDLANPLAATGGAAFVTKIDMNSDMAMAIADFAFTAAGSFGDAGPAGAAVTERTRSTAADAGPVHVNTVETAVTLGTVGGVYADGVNHAASDAHASDDGVFLRLDNGSLALAQDRLLSAGRTYALEAHVRVAAGHGSVQTVNVAGWIAANNAANAMIPSSATAVGFGQPNGQGVATASLTVPASPSPTGGLSASTLRVAASTQAGITAPDNTTGQYAPQPGGSSANGRPWVSDGEIEDYRYHVVTGQVRVALVSQGGTVANAPYTVSNAAATAPSATGGTLKTVAADQAWTSPAQHAISNTGAATTVTLTSVPAGHTVVGGACLDSTSGGDPWGATTTGHLPVADKPVVSGQSITIPAGTYGTPGPNNLWNDLTCTLTIGKMPSAAASEFTLSPADGKAQVGADVTGTVVVRDASAAVMSGMTVRLASDDARVTLKDSAGQAITSCVTDGQGACQVRVSSDVAATYANVVHATVQEVAGGPWAEVGPAAVAAKRSPKTVAFTAGNWPSAAKSELAVSPPGPVKAGEDYTLAATLYDGVGGANGGRGNLISGATVTFSVDAGQDFGSKGFSAPTCTSDSAGRCQVTFSSSKPGTFNLHALVADREQADHRLTDVGVTSPQARVVTVADVSAANSSLTVTPNAVVGRSAAVTLTLKDAYDNPVTGLADAQLNTGVAPTGPVLSALAETPADSGVYTGTLTSQTNGTHTVSAQPSPLAQALTASTEFSWRTLPTDGTSVLAVTPNPARAGSSLTAALVVKDRLGRAVPGLGDVLTLTSPGMADISTLPTESPAGTYTWHADAVEAAGPYQALVQDGATGSVTGDYVLTQVASAANSSVVISDNGQGRQANDTHFYTVTVSLRDLTDVPIADGMDDAPDGQPKLSLVGPTNTDYTIWDLAHAGAGVYTAKIKASAAANYTLTASYDRGQNAVVLGSVTARFSSPIPSADHSSFTVSVGDQVVGTGQHTVTATLRNDQDQPVEVPAAQLGGSRALPSATVGAFAPVAGQPGVYQAPITATVAGLKTVEAVWTDGTSTVAVPPATAGQDKVMFVPGPAVDPLGTFAVTTGNKLTNGTAFHEAWVMFVDQHGNPRPGDSATFTLLDDAETATATS